MAGRRAWLLAASLGALAGAHPARAAIDPVLVQQAVVASQRLAIERQGHASRWHVDAGTHACLLRDADGARPRVLFIRETGRISMWLAPAPEALLPPPGAQPYQLYFVPLDGDPKLLVANEFGASLWQEPLTRSTDPGLAVEIDPATLAAKYPTGVGIILAQGARTLFADILTPDVMTAVPDLTRCRGGR